MYYKIKWANKFSKEEGYVGKVLKTKGYFENTYDKEEAKKYRRLSEAEKDIGILNEMGEGDNNDFTVIESE